MTARNIDTNGWIEIKNNPISRVGVFPYKGRTIDPKGELGLAPETFYNVYRSAEELSKPATIASFRLIPWTNDHPTQMLGNSPDLMPAEDKGIHGVTGEDVNFDGEFLLSNVKVLSKELADDINSGKIELSIGYWALYRPEKGEYNGQQYDFVQYDITGNHLSSVDEGRSGREVSVLDSKQHDGEPSMKEDNKPDETTKANDADGETGANGVMERLDRIEAVLSKLMGLEKAEGQATDEDEKKEDGDVSKDAKDTYGKDNKGKDADEDNKKEESKKESMDAAEIRRSVFKEAAARDKLAARVSHYIGSFDSAEMDEEEVARYALKKLKINCKRGDEKAVLAGYLMGASRSEPVATADGMIDLPDSTGGDFSQIDAFFDQGRGK